MATPIPCCLRAHCNIFRPCGLLQNSVVIYLLCVFVCSRRVFDQEALCGCAASVIVCKYQSSKPCGMRRPTLLATLARCSRLRFWASTLMLYDTSRSYRPGVTHWCCCPTTHLVVVHVVQKRGILLGGAQQRSGLLGLSVPVRPKLGLHVLAPQWAVVHAGDVLVHEAQQGAVCGSWARHRMPMLMLANELVEHGLQYSRHRMVCLIGQQVLLFG